LTSQKKSVKKSSKKGSIKRTSEEKSERASKQASEQESKQASKRTSKQAFGDLDSEAFLLLLLLLLPSLGTFTSPLSLNVSTTSRLARVLIVFTLKTINNLKLNRNRYTNNIHNYINNNRKSRFQDYLLFFLGYFS